MASSWKHDTFEVRFLTRREAKEAALLHEQELPFEFLSRMGTGFLTRYYQSFVESPHAAAVVAEDGRTGRLEGIFIATFDTEAHYSYAVRRHGAALARHAALQAIRNPALARDFLKTRLGRYLRGVLRSLIYRKKTSKKPSEQVGFPTYISVRRDRHSRGIGAALFEAYEEMARESGIMRLELVTRPGELGAGPFFEKLDYHYMGDLTSRSGELYSLYAKSLGEDVDPE